MSFRDKKVISFVAAFCWGLAGLVGILKHKAALVSVVYFAAMIIFLLIGLYYWKKDK